MQQSTSRSWRTLHTAYCKFPLQHPPSHPTDQLFPDYQIGSWELPRLPAKRERHLKHLHALPPETIVIGLRVQQSACRLVTGVRIWCISDGLRVSFELWYSGKNVSNLRHIWLKKWCYLELDYFCIHKTANEGQAWFESYTRCPVCTKSCFSDFLQGLDKLMHHHCFHSFSELSCCITRLAEIFEKALQQWKELHSLLINLSTIILQQLGLTDLKSSSFVMSLITSWIWCTQSQMSSSPGTFLAVSRRAAFVTLVLSDTVAAHFSMPTDSIV